MPTNLLTETDRAEVLVEDTITHGVYEHRTGPPSVECRVQGHISLDGREYRFERVVRVRCEE